MVCSEDCFHCPFPDCVLDRETARSKAESKAWDAEVRAARALAAVPAVSGRGGAPSAYYYAHREERLAYQCERYYARREELRAYQRERYYALREELRAYQLARYYRNRDKLREYQRERYWALKGG